MAIKSKITAIGSYVPERVLTNHDLEKFVETSDDWITSRTGIKERRIVAKQEGASDLALKASQNALQWPSDNSGRTGNSTPSNPSPATKSANFSKGIFVLDGLITTGLLLGVRGSFRLFLETQKRKTLSGDKVLIYGAGRGGELLLREIINNKNLKVQPVGFLDDDPLKKGKKIQGYPILGPFKDIDGIHAQHQLNGILISFSDMNGNHIGALEAAKDFCSKKKIHLKRFKIKLQDVELESEK